MCDLLQPDIPIVYATDAFAYMTGYSPAEIIGRNCRFLQHPPPPVSLDQKQAREVDQVNEVARRELKEKMARRQEAQVKLINFRKDGSSFVNILTVIPILWEDEKAAGKARQYYVGFQYDTQRGLFG